MRGSASQHSRMSSKGVAAMFSYIREELLLEKYIEVKKSIRADPTQGRAVVD